MAFEWVTGLFQSEQTRGLSGGDAGSVALDDSNPYYNYRLRRHQAEGDLVADPGLLWYTSPYVKRRTGLGAHVAMESADGVANYTDVLLILSREDHARAQAATGWLQQVRDLLRSEFEGHCAREGLQVPYPQRPLGFRLLCDGSAEMGGRGLGLEPGEFVTGLLPNLYTGPVEGSRAVIGVHVNLPGIWEGYREVGRLYDDQILFTLGSSWLDNFSHPFLREAALYRLQQHPDGTFVHIVNPDLQDRYQVSSTYQGGASVLTLAKRSGEPLAYIVLAIIEGEEEAERPAAARRAERPVPVLPQVAPAQPAVPSVAPPMLLDDELPVGRSESIKGLGGRTIIPDAPAQRIFTLQERGALLQKVHFSAFMLGYDVYVGTRGELGTVVEEPAATFQVRKRDVTFVAHTDGVRVDGVTVSPGEETLLVGNVSIEVAGNRFEYRDIRGLDVEGWPYVAEIRRPASSTYMIWGEEYQIGRSRESRVVLPDEARNDNIHWKPSVGDGTTIRARTGVIPKSNFYTDSIMVASKHAIVDLREARPRIACIATHCFVYLRRHGEILALWPTSRGKLPTEAELEPGDEVLIGNCLFQVGYTPEPDAADDDAPLTADALVEAVDVPTFNTPESDAPTFEERAVEERTSPGRELREEPAAAREADPFDPEDVPSAWGLGERGRRPPPVPVSRIGLDSIVDDPLDDDLADDPPESADRLEVPYDDPPTLSDDEVTVSVIGLPDLEAPATDDPPAAPPAPAEAPARPGDGVVVFTDDSEAQFELGRPMHLVLVGWMINGEAICGNHGGADMILPENRIAPDQRFEACDYFRVWIRGRRGELELASPSELRIDGAAPEKEIYDDPAAHTIDVVRRDDRGDEDFAVRLSIGPDPALPDPRAAFVAIDTTDRLAAALVTKGLPRNAARRLRLGGVELTLRYDGGGVTVSDYLDTYRHGAGYRPFFVQRDGGRFTTAPEDGADFRLTHGDRLILGIEVYALRAE